jgi:hypothetical protein
MNLGRLILLLFIIAFSLTILLLSEAFFFLPVAAAQLSSTQLGVLSSLFVNNFRNYSIPFALAFFFSTIVYGFLYSKERIVKELLVLAIFVPIGVIIGESMLYYYALFITPLYNTFIGIVFWALFSLFIIINSIVLNSIIENKKL